jgi:hypothetical protein
VVRAWFALVWKSVGMAIVAVAAQLGVAQTVGIVRWTDVSSESWSTLLTWLAFIAVVSVMAGAAVGRRAVRPTGPSVEADPSDRVGATLVAAFCAAIGAAAGESLTWLAAQSAIVPVSAYPELVVATTAGAAVVVGTVLAIVGGFIPTIGRNVRVTVVWIWAVGVFGAIAGYATHKSFRAPRLAVLDAPSLIPDTWWSAPSLMIAIAVVVGAIVAASARWRGAGRLGTIFSGSAGPGVVAAAYLIVQPALSGAPTNLLDPFHVSVIAVAAGLVGSAAVGLLPGPARRLPGARPRRAEPKPRAEEPVASRPIPTLAGNPPYQEDYSDWIRDIGPSGQGPAPVYGQGPGQPYDSGFGTGHPR